MKRFKPAVKQPHPISGIELVPSGGGVFDVEVDGQLVYSKFQTGRHAEHEEVLETISRIVR
ncbi:MAG: SelT/SelW/SelH family protein [Chlorobia bacterium]|nr:SelT/SelW/SelH family protein [Fimbriimonadaceae bacterium]